MYKCYLDISFLSLEQEARQIFPSFLCCCFFFSERKVRKIVFSNRKMCAPSQGAMLPYGLKVPSPYLPFGPSGGLNHIHLSALDFQRSQLNDYNVRVQFGLRNYQNSMSLSPFHAYITDPYTQAYFYKHDPRARFVQEEPKPSHSYIGLIGMAILNSKEKKLVLSDIYQWILDNYPYFRTRGPGWRNSIRHNLSLNDCFIKAGRSANGKGHYWAVHPANVEDFERGDFRRRRAQRKVRRHMGLSVPDDDDSPTPSPTQPWPHHDMALDSDRSHMEPLSASGNHAVRPVSRESEPVQLVLSPATPTYGLPPGQPRKHSRKRLFDMASLLAPDDDDEEEKNTDQDLKNERPHIQHISGFMIHATQEQKSHEMKSNLSNANRPDNIEKCSASELDVTGNRVSNGCTNENSLRREDDQESEDVQVMSEEDSLPQEEAENLYTNIAHPFNEKYEKEKTQNTYRESKLLTEVYNYEPTVTPSSPNKRESKTENALDLSSSIHPSGEPYILKEGNRKFEYTSFSPCKTLKNGAVHMPQDTGKIDESRVKEVTNLDNFSAYNDSKTCGDGYATNKSNTSSCSLEQSKQNDAEAAMTKFSYCTGFEAREKKLPSFLSNGLEQKFLHYRPGQHDPRQLQIPGSGDSTIRQNPEKGLVESDSGREVENGGAASDQSLGFVSETARGTSDQMRWTEISKTALSRDRMSAFSTLGLRSHSIYSPFHIRGFPMGPQRVFPTATPMRAGITNPVLSLSAPLPLSGSVAVIKALDNGAVKCGHVSNNNNTNNIINNHD